MYKFLPYYERELAILSRDLQDYARTNPGAAVKLGLSGGQYTDPGVVRVMQGTAFLAARASQELDYFHTRVTNDVLGVLAPFYLRPIPSCSVAHVDAGGKHTAATIPRGTALATQAVPMSRFRTVYDVTVPAIRLSAHYSARVNAPASLGLPAEAGGELVISIVSADASLSLGEAVAISPRVCIDIDAARRAALYDALFARTLCICVESAGYWRKLTEPPFQPVGFAIAEAFLPTSWRQDDSLRVLAEYMAFPEKFEFFDIDLKPVLDQCPPGARRVVLHMILPDLHRTTTPHLLGELPPAALRLGCTPIVNLFAHEAAPIRVQAGRNTYPLLFPRSKGVDSTVYSINAMKWLRNGAEGCVTIDMPWLYGPKRAKDQHCWHLKPGDRMMGMEDAVSFVGTRGRPIQLDEGTVTVQATCTNGDQPAQLAAGAVLAGNELVAKYPVRLLRVPTASLALADGPDSHNDVMVAISAAGRASAQAYLPDLLHLLRLHARPGCVVTERQLAGIVGLEQRKTTDWMPNDYGSSLEHGYEIRLTVDEAAFTERSIYAFAQVLDRLFGHHMRCGTFTRLIVLNTIGQVRVRCALRPGGQTSA
jgi:type VI secretion system protein ImpG